MLRAICLASSDAWCFAPVGSSVISHCSQRFLSLFGIATSHQAESASILSVTDRRLAEGCRALGLPPGWIEQHFKSGSSTEDLSTASKTEGLGTIVVSRKTVLDSTGRPIGRLLLLRPETGSGIPGSVWHRAVAARKELAVLSARETEILNLISTGLTNKAVARAANISEKTVEKHRANIMRKLGARSAADLIRCVTEASILAES